ncbi:hypothetical protein [Poseidonibacter ostreae]|nr:hypothetical protein [Poseidonibacter ostreae]
MEDLNQFIRQYFEKLEIEQEIINKINAQEEVTDVEYLFLAKENVS